MKNKTIANLLIASLLSILLGVLIEELNVTLSENILLLSAIGITIFSVLAAMRLYEFDNQHAEDTTKKSKPLSLILIILAVVIAYAGIAVFEYSNRDALIGLDTNEINGTLESEYYEPVETIFYVKEDYAIVRGCASSQCNVLGYLHKNGRIVETGTTTVTLEELPEWMPIVSPEKETGYIHKSLLSDKPIE